MGFIPRRCPVPENAFFYGSDFRLKLNVGFDMDLKGMNSLARVQNLFRVFEFWADRVIEIGTSFASSELNLAKL
ncbi:hypothetical protein Pla52n_67550 [Stieleria varia]|uniref:Uncharacterized protein n=1 Tax=Stieleria varia TaxID=2528005 RepID=A0A5C5ZRD4_9BACT|nr:hypothetical protein Pla52n_67550 [Stieleria varia]